jgi:hypothetical protein
MKIYSDVMTHAVRALPMALKNTSISRELYIEGIRNEENSVGIDSSLAYNNINFVCRASPR